MSSNLWRLVGIFWYFLVFKKYFTLRGRARRSEYWFFVLFNMIAGFIFGVIDFIIGTEIEIASFGAESESIDIGLISSIYGWIAFIPSITVGVRRLHDIGRSGWWLLSPLLSIVVLVAAMIISSTTGMFPQKIGAMVSFITLVGMALTVFTFTLLDSQPFTNQYGPNPKSTGYSSQDQGNSRNGNKQLDYYSNGL